MPVRLLLADDHPLILDGLDRLFGGEADLEVIARVADGQQAIEAARRHRPDVAVLDVKMPGLSGLEIASRLATEAPSTRIVLLTAAMGEYEVAEAMRSGVKGLVLKDTAPVLLLECVRDVYRGRRWIDKELAQRNLATFVDGQTGRGRGVHLLTAREEEIVRLVVRGMRNKDIGHALSISEGTVKIHLNRVYDKLSVSNRVELVNAAREAGLA